MAVCSQPEGSWKYYCLPMICMVMLAEAKKALVMGVHVK